MLTEKITNEYKAGLSQRMHDSGMNSPEAAERLVYDEILALVEANDNDMTVFQKDATLPFVALVRALRKQIRIPDIRATSVPPQMDNHLKEVVLVVSTALSFPLMMLLFKSSLWLSTILAALVGTVSSILVNIFSKQKSRQIDEYSGYQAREAIDSIGLFAQAYDDIVRHSGEQLRLHEEEIKCVKNNCSLENQYSSILKCLIDLYGYAVETGSDVDKNYVAKSIKKAFSSVGYDLISYNGENVDYFDIVGDGDIKNMVMGTPALYSRDKRAIITRGKLYR